MSANRNTSDVDFTHRTTSEKNAQAKLLNMAFDLAEFENQQESKKTQYSWEVIERKAKCLFCPIDRVYTSLCYDKMFLYKEQLLDADLALVKLNNSNMNQYFTTGTKNSLERVWYRR